MTNRFPLLGRLQALPQKLRNRYAYRQPITEYVPGSLVAPVNRIPVATAWAGLELVIPDILDRFNVGRDSCIEFGVEYGYSAVIFSNYFSRVIGVDTFEGDIHTRDRGNHFEATRDSLAAFNNIELFKSLYQDWIQHDDKHYDFAHVDIIHTYKDTFRCGLWAAQHSKVTIFHDTESFVDVRNAVIAVAKATGKRVYNYPLHYGLGIVAP